MGATSGTRWPRTIDVVEPMSTRGERALGRLEALDRPRPAPQHAPRPIPPVASAVPSGYRTYSRSIRSRGPLVALVLPLVLGVFALVLLHDSHSTGRGVGGFLAAICAAPLLPAFGAPIRTGAGRYLAAVVASGVLWIVIGVVASRRAARRPLATWGGYWAEYLLLALSAWVGVGLSVVAANLVLGRVLL